MSVEYIEHSWPDGDLAGWDGPGWYFWDESQSQCIGPFEDAGEASYSAAVYAAAL